MQIERIVAKQIPYPTRMSFDLIENWADGIPLYSEDDPAYPEWKPTPLFELDLTGKGYGTVFVKDESVNPTGTIKDRASWEFATLYRDFARSLWLRKKCRGENNVDSLITPRMSVITAGNVGRSLSKMLRRYNLPPLKILLDFDVDPRKLEFMKEMYADIYLADLSKELTPEEIKKLTDNEDGVDITSLMPIEPQAVFYDWHVHEVFNEKPGAVFVPYGSGRLMENYLTWQFRTFRDAMQGRADKRLKVPATVVIGMDVLGAEPAKQDSIADKLTKPCNPFALLLKDDIDGMKTFGATGCKTGIYRVPEERIQQAFDILKEHCNTEPSGAAGLALYLEKYPALKGRKVLIVNTGRGLYEAKA